jgi:deferrochelatase/peroxidase EfeB
MVSSTRDWRSCRSSGGCPSSSTQARLAGEPLEEYIVPEGGGFYFALPGVVDGGAFLGDGLFA